jgi:hypothetical protein
MRLLPPSAIAKAMISGFGHLQPSIQILLKLHTISVSCLCHQPRMYLQPQLLNPVLGNYQDQLQMYL